MIHMEFLVWLPPLLFILHDMEEIIWALAWKKGEACRKKYLAVGLSPFGSAQNTAGFAACVYEELLILTAVSLVSLWSGRYGLWYGMVAANALHLVLMHIVGTTAIYRSYVPGLATALLTVGPLVWILVKAAQLLQYGVIEIVGYSLLATALMAVNLRLLHRQAARIGAWVERSMDHV